MKKQLFAIIVLYSFQFIGACVQDDYVECDCSGITEIGVDFIGLDVDAQELTGDGFSEMQEIGESVLKENFVLNLNLEFTEKEIVSNLRKIHSRSFGFPMAYACTCAVPYLVTQQVERIEVLAAEADSSNFVDVSNSFKVLDFFDNDGFFTIVEAIEASRQVEIAKNFIPNYKFLIADEAAIPQLAVFRILITLADGTELLQETSQITFE